MSTTPYEKIRKAVIRSFIWSLAFELSKSAGYDYKLPIMKRIVAMQSVASIVDIMMQECKSHNKNKDDIEELKMKAWNMLADRYAEQEIIANVPTMIEAVYFSNFEWLSKVKNLDANINRMIFLAIDNDVKPEVTRIITDEYNDILSKVIYEYMKEHDVKQSTTAQKA